ncbi:MAG: YciI family protein [Qingshengfaniella sp.]
MGFFLMRCVHHPGRDADRDAHRPAHRDWVGSGGKGLVSVLIGSATTDGAGASTGNFGILEAASAEDARRFAEGDPFNAAGIVSGIEIIPLADGLQAHRITDPMSPRL